MKQNLTILFDNLKKHIPAVLSGVPDQELHLCRPEYYLEDSREFKKDHLYIIQGEQLPRRAVVEKRQRPYLCGRQCLSSLLSGTYGPNTPYGKSRLFPSL